MCSDVYGGDDAAPSSQLVVGALSVPLSRLVFLSRREHAFTVRVSAVSGWSLAHSAQGSAYIGLQVMEGVHARVGGRRLVVTACARNMKLCVCIGVWVQPSSAQGLPGSSSAFGHASTRCLQLLMVSGWVWSYCP